MKNFLLAKPYVFMENLISVERGVMVLAILLVATLLLRIFLFGNKSFFAFFSVFFAMTIFSIIGSFVIFQFKEKPFFFFLGAGFVVNAVVSFFMAFHNLKPFENRINNRCLAYEIISLLTCILIITGLTKIFLSAF